MSLKYCEICKKDTEHKRSEMAVFVLSFSFLFLAMIVGALGLSVLTMLMLAGWGYYLRKTKQCVECKKNEW